MDVFLLGVGRHPLVFCGVQEISVGITLVAISYVCSKLITLGGGWTTKAIDRTG